MQRLQHHDRGQQPRRHRRASVDRGVHIRERLRREQSPPVFGQEREHAPGRNHLPAHDPHLGTGRNPPTTHHDPSLNPEIPPGQTTKIFRTFLGPETCRCRRAAAPYTRISSALPVSRLLVELSLTSIKELIILIRQELEALPARYGYSVRHVEAVLDMAWEVPPSAEDPTIAWRLQEIHNAFVRARITREAPDSVLLPPWHMPLLLPGKAPTGAAHHAEELEWHLRHHPDFEPSRFLRGDEEPRRFLRSDDSGQPHLPDLRLENGVAAAVQDELRVQREAVQREKKGLNAPLPVVVYVKEGDHLAVLATIEELAQAIARSDQNASEDVIEAFPPVEGSFFQRMRLIVSSAARRELTDGLRRAAELRLEEQQAVVNGMYVEQISKLITALENTTEAAFLVGSMVFIKAGGRLRTRILTTRELLYLQEHPGLMRDPASMEVALDAALPPDDAVPLHRDEAGPPMLDV